MFRRLLEKIARNPSETLEFLCAVFFLLTAVWLLSPYLPYEASLSYRLLQDHTLVYIAAAIQGLLAGFTFYALRAYSWPKRDRVRANCLFGYFLLFHAYGLAGVFVYGLSNLGWMIYFIMATLCAMKYLRLKWELK